MSVLCVYSVLGNLRFECERVIRRRFFSLSRSPVVHVEFVFECIFDKEVLLNSFFRGWRKSSVADTRLGVLLIRKYVYLHFRQ